MSDVRVPSGPYEREKVYFIGDFRFPAGDAAAIRTMSLARICRDLGFDVTIIGKGTPQAEHYRNDLNGYYVEGIRYLTMNPQKVSKVDKLLHPLRRLGLYVATLSKEDLTGTRAVIVNACSSAMHVPLLKAFCSRRRIPLVADVCEWYDSLQMAYGRLDPAYYVFNAVFRWVLPRFRNVIVVSRLLERHFAPACPHIIRIAAPLDVRNIPFASAAPANRLVIGYAGVPTRKDLLKTTFEALLVLAPEERARVEFRLIGPTREDLERALEGSRDLLEQLGETVQPLGRMPHERVVPFLQQCHVSILVRPDKRYANAGFPSKVAESLAAGVPVLLNFTSDLGEYLAGSGAVFPIADTSAQSIANGIRGALTMSTADLATRQRASRAKAEEYFDYRNILADFSRYLDGVA